MLTCAAWDYHYCVSTNLLYIKTHQLTVSDVQMAPPQSFSLLPPAIDGGN